MILRGRQFDRKIALRCRRDNVSKHGLARAIEKTLAIERGESWQLQIIIDHQSGLLILTLLAACLSYRYTDILTQRYQPATARRLLTYQITTLTMDQWLDSLSEDWVSQPRSDHSSSVIQGSVLRDSPSPNSNASQSRIPRYKPTLASGITTTSGKEPGGSSSLRKSSIVENALKEKTSSNLNASPKRYSQGQVKAQVANAASTRLRGTQASRQFSPTVPQDTVQHKASPAKKQDAYGTPEWRRRVLKENGGGDLFNPKQLGLEGVFKPPTVRSTPHARMKGIKKGFAPNNIPSSPPSYPRLPRQRSKAPASDPKKPAAATIPRNESSDETQMPHDNEGRMNRHSGSAQSRNDGDVAQGENPNSSTPSGSPQPNHFESPQLPALPCHRLTSIDSESKLAHDSLEHSGVSSEKTRNEDISPFYVSRHNTIDGRVEYAAIDMSMRRLRSQMEKMRMQQQNLPSSRSSDHGIDYKESRPAGDLVLQERMDEVTSQSLPDDLSMGTDTFAANGGFVSIRRGGYSTDGSFQRRPLSPSLLHDLDGPSLRLPSPTNTQRDPTHTHELPRNFSQTKSRTPSSPPRSSTPHTPRHQKNENVDSNDRPRSSGSPLKLFDKYDTFTKERLVRRMSKFEETLHNDLLEDSKIDSPNESPSSPSPRRRHQYRQNHTGPSAEAPNGRRISSFGYGELNHHEFPPYRGLDSGHSINGAPQNNDPDRSLQNQTNGFRFQRTTSYQSETEITSRSKTSKESIFKHVQRDQGDESGIEGLRGESLNEYISQTVQTATGKRLPYSPAKDPAPKRRRTLRYSEEMDHVHLHLQEHIAAQKSPISSGRKRKDALYDSDHQAADPGTIAMRHIRQPKVPTRSHTSVWRAIGPETRVTGATDQAVIEGSLQLGVDDNPAIDPPTQIVAGALATVALNTAKEVTCGSRKASVTTADFFNEAQQIMQFIRAKGRPHSSHTNTEGSEAGHPTIVEESVVYDSTKDEFSRPPSREGSPRGPKPSAKPDARVISHLRKFEDNQDLGLALSSSIKVLKISQSRRGSRASASACDEANDANSDTESDPPNTRIRESIVQAHKRKNSSSTYDFSVLEPEQQVRSQGSQPTSGPSSGRSDPTGSSQGSTNRMVIAPETVAHLLSDQMAGMVFDRQRQLWVKRKSSPNVGGLENLEHTQSERTEEDFFGDIPDLTVNEMEELQRVKETVSSVRSMGSATDNVSVCDQAMFREMQKEAPGRVEQIQNARPKTAEGKSIAAVDNSSAPSIVSHFASSCPQPGTRTTSWGDDAFSYKEPQLPIHSAAAAGKSLENTSEQQVEHEISIFEGRESRTPKHQSNRKHQARVITVAFSSPLVDHKESEFERVQGFDSDEGELSLDDSPVRHNTPLDALAKRPPSSGSAGKPRRRSASRRLSLCQQSYLPRPMSRLDEEDEMSMIHCSIGNRRMSMELAITTPLPLSRSILVPSTIEQRSSIGFQLSPLPDFTVHQIDKPVDSNHGQVTKRLPTGETGNRLSLCAQSLVRNLTDLEPYEPYWDYIRSVDLHDRDLTTLHMLDEFCGRIEELDVSENQLAGLHGIPHTVRRLNIRANCLSDLAAWDSLRNLQYLDVSSNQLADLRGFQHLIHLRSLKADNNEIENLNGLEDLNGLINLRLRGNRLREVDFEDFDL